MSPRIVNGDIVGADPTRTPEDGDVVVVCMEDGSWVLRRYWVKETGPVLTLDSDSDVTSGVNPSLLLFRVSRLIHSLLGPGEDDGNDVPLAVKA